MSDLDWKLPKGWEETTIGAIANVQMGQSPPSSSYNQEGRGIPFFQGKAEFTELYPIVSKWCDEPQRIAQENDILLSVRAPVGSVNIADVPCCIGRGLASIRYDYCTKFLFYFFQVIEKKLDEQGTGTTFRAISGDVIKNFPCLFPPLAEQERIVAKIEELFSSLDAGVESLKAAREQLKVYRQAVLKRAFEGKLTNENVKDGELPEGWKLLPLKKIVKPVDGLRRGPFGGAIKKSCFIAKGYKIYEQGNAINDDPYRGEYFISEAKYNELKNFAIKPGDFIVSCSGTLGRIMQIPLEAIPGVINQALLRIRLNNEVVDDDFFLQYFRSQFFQKKLIAQSQGTAMSNMVGIKDLRETLLYIPPLDTQINIITEIESRFSVCDKLEESIERGIGQAEALRQSILKKAFEGRLVPQDPKDEPASVLLERIQSEKNAAGGTKVKAGAVKRGRKPRA